MFCRNCGTEIPVDAIACGKCGWDPRKGKKFCWNCGVQTDEGAIMCVKCGASLQQQSQLFTSTSDKKLVVGLVAIFLGCLGIHKFMLGYTNAGLIMLIGSIAGSILGSVLSFLVIPAILLVVPFGMSIIGIIEGIIYLTKTDAEFNDMYVKHEKPWF